MELVSVFLGDARFDGALGLEIGLVAHQQLVHGFVGIPVDFLKPLFDVVEGVLVGDVVNDNDAVSAAIIGRGNGAETLLAGGIPNLKLDRLAFEFDGADFLKKIDGIKVINVKRQIQ